MDLLHHKLIAAYTWPRDQEVSGSSPGCARSTLSLWERLFTCKRLPDWRQCSRVRFICNDSSSATLPMELRKLQWLQWRVGDPT